MTWNKRNQQFALSCGLRRSTLEVCQYILRRTKPGQTTEIEIDLRVINKWIGKYRLQGEYDRKTIKQALTQLDEKTEGWILITKSYTWAIHKIIVRPLEMVLEQKSESGDKNPKPKRGNPMFSDAHKERLVKQQQQDISSMDRYFQAIDLKFDHSALVKLYRYSGRSIAEVKKAIELLLYRHSSGTDQIGNPYGFIVSCLRDSWQKNFDLNYSPNLPKFENVKDITHFVREIFQGNRLAQT